MVHTVVFVTGHAAVQYFLAAAISNIEDLEIVTF